MPLCIDLMELDRWSSGKRITACLNVLQLYGPAAKGLVKDLDPLREFFAGRRTQDDRLKKRVQLLEETIAKITARGKAPKLRSLKSPGTP